MKITHDSIYEGLKANGGFSGGCIDIAAVADFLGINLISWALPESLTSKISVKTGIVHLVVNQRYTSNPPVYRFMAAHAIGHIALGHVKAGSELVDEMSNYRIPGATEMEQAATRWGIELLAPRKLVALLNKSDQNPLNEICQQFSIPLQVAKYLCAQH